MSDILAFLILFLPITWWVWWMNKDKPKPKLDFGPERPKSLRSLAGLEYILWNCRQSKDWYQHISRYCNIRNLYE